MNQLTNGPEVRADFVAGMFKGRFVQLFQRVVVLIDERWNA